MAYGLKIIDAAGNEIQVRPEISTIVDAGTLKARSHFWTDWTYGHNVKLPGLGKFKEEDIGLLFNIRWWWAYAHLSLIYYGPWFLFTRNMLPDVYYYTRDESDGTMSAFGVETLKDSIYNQHGIVLWDKMGNTEFDTVRIFFTTICYVYDRSASAYLRVFAPLYVDEVDFVLFLKNLQEN